jgi:hypothetical protein
MGLDARDAACILKKISCGTEIVIIGHRPLFAPEDHFLAKPVDLGRVRDILRGIFRPENDDAHVRRTA